MQNFTKKSTIFTFLLVFLFTSSIAYSGDLEWTGTLNSRPTELTGTWVIDNISFEADTNTEFNEEYGPLSNGACVEAKYTTSNGLNIANRIRTVESYKCGGGPSNGDDGLKTYAIINSFPPNLIGTWVIGNITYTTDNNTHFEQEHGPFSVGQCVEINYDITTNLASEIETESSYKCNNNNNNTSYSQVYGALESFPTNLIGSWSVNGLTYTANTNTHFEQEDGPFFGGGCVEIKYITNTTTAAEISTEEAYKCQLANNTSIVEQKFYGFIETTPTDLQNGTWIVNGGSFISNATTNLKTEHGPFTLGACVEIEYYQDTTNAYIADEIGTEELYKCNNNTYTNQVYGTIANFPTNLYGAWLVNGVTYQAIENTEFEQEYTSFTNTGCVKIKYYIQYGVNYATKIESEETNTCYNPNNTTSADINKIYAPINTLPYGTGTLGGGTLSDLIGTWVIGGVSYQATANTQYKQDHALFESGTCVEAKYTTLNTNNTLTKVESQNSNKCTNINSGNEEFKSYGTVEIMPTNTLTGTWQVSGISYQTSNNTQFEQEHGFFAVGAYVEVKYTSTTTSNIASSIETHVAPGRGLETNTGHLTAYNSDDKWDDWTIDDILYAADPIIEIGTSDETLVVGQQVIFNTYRNNSNGKTYITIINQVKQIFLPFILK